MNLRIRMQATGGPEVLEPERGPMPEPGPGEVLLHVKVAGVNRADALIRAGAWPTPGELPYVPGFEVAGDVLMLGPGVEGVRTGDSVLAIQQGLGQGARGGYQRMLCVPAANVVPVPETLTVQEAGALGLPAVSAWLSLQALGVHPGRRVLITGGSGAVGHLAIQLAKGLGAEVVTTTRSPDKRAFLSECGADRVVVVGEPGWESRLGRVDRALDLVGPGQFEEAVRALVPGGWLVHVGGAAGDPLVLSSWDLVRPVTLTGWSSARLGQAEIKRAVVSLAHRLADGTLTLHRLSSYPLVDAAKAHAALEDAARVGRVILV
ncbi:MAG: zinc-binding alcohol dehydrogenase family protein [Alphaproteobacteria bacterium]|nr:zinc-binding alcohol dehydrogenase family protein [Alphaproteobacteria bacterium]MCB9795973.1 zinc-binding alcohol dehydrogenase family protein [Alphaproteobacteria bacterium]